MSEVAILEFLEETAVPSPKVHLYQQESHGNPVGTSFVLMEKMPGTALRWNDARFEQRTKVMEQLVDILLELKNINSRKNGANCSSGRTGQGWWLCPSTGPLFETPGKTPGPFSKLETAYKAMITGVNERHRQQRDHKSPCR